MRNSLAVQIPLVLPSGTRYFRFIMWYPLLFKPVYKDYIWGGDKIGRRFQRALPPGIYAESWEVSDRPEGMSVVTNGPLAGKSLHELVETMGRGLLGDFRADLFPLLIKIIDARETLSVQVHPNDESAKKYGGEPKTEMWYVLEAEPGAQLYCGLKPGVDAKKLEEAIRSNQVADLLMTIPVKRGDAVFVPGGRVHAIGAGCLLLEVQQNSNTTYRLYDWDRVGPDGKSRPLHIRESLQVIRWNDSNSAKLIPQKRDALGKNEHWEILMSSFFNMERFVLREPLAASTNGKTFHVLFVAEGKVRVQAGQTSEILSDGTSCLIPAALSKYTCEPLEKGAELIRVSIK